MFLEPKLGYFKITDISAPKGIYVFSDTNDRKTYFAKFNSKYDYFLEETRKQLKENFRETDLSFFLYGFLDSVSNPGEELA